ncbi:MAG TPA: glycosyl hydrolase [Anaerolineaceae bacterium]
MDNLRNEFINPPLPLRGAPFWSWNDRLEVPELVRQVQDMKAHGMGGFFMHSREGLETTYMSPEWLECIRETVKAARETGMSAWLYDEDRWPSGFAGGLVPSQGDAFRSKFLTLDESAAPPPNQSGLLRLFAGVIKNGTLFSLRRLDSTTSPLQPGETCLALYRRVCEPSEWFNDDAYADNLNPDSVKAFLDITYETYRKEVGAEFGKAIPGIFTDEPNIISRDLRSGKGALPWTDGLPAYFLAHRGYDLLDHLPWLFYEGERAAKTRHDYWYTISQRFTEAYSKQLGEWCEQNGLAFTGHYLYEQEMGLGIITNGAIMPHYRYQQVPGIDMLTEQNREFLTIKQCSSVANQFGRKRVLSETYGCSGWEFTFEGQKWNGDWQYVLGVNLRCQHLALYTLRGCRKRDYPPAFNYNTTWWKYNGVVEDYFARVGRVTTEGEAVRDVLLIHPIATAWCKMGEGVQRIAEANRFSERLNDFVQALLATHYDFDFGDEQIMAENARIEGGRVIVGRAPYSVVVIPPETRTLLASTVELLARLLQAGGKLVAFDPLPEWIEAQSDPRLIKLWQHPGVIVLPSVDRLNSTLEALLARRVSLVTPQGQQAAHLLYMQRAFDGRFAYFMVNNDRSKGYPVTVELEGSGRLEEWNALTGEIQPVYAQEKAGKLVFSTYFAPAGSRIFVVDPLGKPAAPGTPTFLQEERWKTDRTMAPAFIGPVCKFTRTDPNVLTLDMCKYRLNNGEWSEEMEVWRAQEAVRRSLGMRSNYYNGLPQRYRWALTPHPRDGTPLSLRFSFMVDVVPSSPVWLALEGSQWFSIALNGKQVANTPQGWYLDRSFHKIFLPELHKGENELILNCAYTNYMEIEDCYLLGDFGVSLERVVIAEPDRLHFGDWTSQGYPHYAGSIIYHSQVNFNTSKRIRLFLEDYKAVDIAIWVNGILAGHIPWVSANGMDLTPFLHTGENALDIEVVSSPRNMLGPLHRAAEHEPWTDWRSFRRTDSTFTPEYVLWHWGLYGQVRLVEE